MVVLLIILFFFLAVPAYLLFAPFYMELDSNQGICGIRFHRLARANLRLSGDTILLDLNIIGWKKTIDLLTAREKEEKPAKHRERKRRKRVSLKKIKAILESFRVKAWYLDMDTGQPSWNGIFFPVFLVLSRCTGRTFQINFLNRNVIKIQIQNNFARIIWALLF